MSNPIIDNLIALDKYLSARESFFYQYSANQIRFACQSIAAKLSWLGKKGKCIKRINEQAVPEF